MDTSRPVVFYSLRGSVRPTPGTPAHLLLLPALTIGLPPGISLAVLKGAWRLGGEFRCTPKFGVRGRERMPGLASLYHRKSLPFIILNGALLLYSMLPVLFAWQRGTWFAIPLFLFFPMGYVLVMARDIRESF